MGYYDRDYMQDSPRRSNPLGGVSGWSLNTWLIVINVAVYVLDRLLLNTSFAVREPIGQDSFGNIYTQTTLPLEHWGYFSAVTAVAHGQVWRFITFQFLHANTEHILFNMIALFFFGPLIQSFLGARRYLAFYLLCGIGGALSYLGLWGTHILISTGEEQLVGASAGIFGVLIAAAMIAPQATVLIYGIIPMKMRTMAWLLLGYAVFTVFRNGPNAGGEAAHLGGAVVGFILINNIRWLNLFDRPKRRPSYSIREL